MVACIPHTMRVFPSCWAVRVQLDQRSRHTQTCETQYHNPTMRPSYFLEPCCTREWSDYERVLVFGINHPTSGSAPNTSPSTVRGLFLLIYIASASKTDKIAARSVGSDKCVLTGRVWLTDDPVAKILVKPACSDRACEMYCKGSETRACCMSLRWVMIVYCGISKSSM
jgi:hypothetical protein